MIIDAWMQHPSAEFLADPMFDSLRRWAHGRLDGGEVPAEATVAAMDAAGVRTGMLCAWWGPRGPLISNDADAGLEDAQGSARRTLRRLQARIAVQAGAGRNHIAAQEVGHGIHDHPAPGRGQL